MELKKIIGFALICSSLNAGVVSAISGPNISSDEYENKERGIIVHKDVDGDGVIDSKDDCLDSDPCKTINGKGCYEVAKVVPVAPVKPLLDTDQDGVFDNKDLCPNTPKGFVVDEKGCSKIVNLDVQFDTSKWDIKSQYTDRIEKFIDFMKKHPEYKAEIQGHTDSRDSEAKNQILSENRANSVKEYIIQNGIDANRLNSVGYGELKPISTNKTAEGRAENRRVIAILKK